MAHHWIETYMLREEFEQHLTDEWEEPEYKGESGPIEIQNKEEPELRMVIVNTSSTAGTLSISLEMGGPFDHRDKDLPKHTYDTSREGFENIVEFVEHFSKNYQNYL